MTARANGAAGSSPAVTPTALRRALDVILRAIEAPAVAQDVGVLPWVPASAVGMTNAQASRWARRNNIAFAKAGKGTMLRRVEVERFLDARANGTRMAPPVVAAPPPDVDEEIMDTLLRASGHR